MRGKPGILYPEQPDGYLFFSDRFFQTLNLNPSLKVFTLAVCQGEVVLQQYGQFRARLQQAGIALRLAPPSVWATWLIGQEVQRKIGGVVPLSSALRLITEASQIEDVFSTGTHCYLYRDPATPGRVWCAHAKIRLDGPENAFAHGRWAQLTPDPQHNVWWITQRNNPKRQILRRQPDGSFINRKLRLTVEP